MPIKSHAISFGRLHTWTLVFYYIKDADTLSLKAPWRETGVWVDLPDQVRVYVDPDNGEAMAFEIKAFTKNFLAKRPDLQPLWKQIKPSPIALRRMETTPFIGQFLEHMERLAYDRERQVDPTTLKRA